MTVVVKSITTYGAELAAPNICDNSFARLRFSSFLRVGDAVCRRRLLDCAKSDDTSNALCSCVTRRIERSRMRPWGIFEADCIPDVERLDFVVASGT